ncbi:putative translation initiation factor IF-2 [Iris pallida]|uniref:Translation initiation factor IF-2 n=1 Tax=Iris pallida TaxID=29817 RepID=A0AAX6FTS5_IRIPA|nr:putative translation initiation factor IF-2 [Iris pallida]
MSKNSPTGHGRRRAVATFEIGGLTSCGGLDSLQSTVMHVTQGRRWTRDGSTLFEMAARTPKGQLGCRRGSS